MLDWIGDIVVVESLESGCTHEFPGTMPKAESAKLYNKLAMREDATVRKLGPSWDGPVAIEIPTEVWYFRPVLA